MTAMSLPRLVPLIRSPGGRTCPRSAITTIGIASLSLRSLAFSTASFGPWVGTDRGGGFLGTRDAASSVQV